MENTNVQISEAAPEQEKKSFSTPVFPCKSKVKRD